MSAVTILLCTYNGARFLPPQLASFEGQDFTGWRLVASDDGSTDDTIAILQRFQTRLGPERVEIRAGPRQGFVANFLSLACDRSVKSDYYAFSDQDDVWEPQKLSRALAQLGALPADEPALYCSRTRLIDEEGRYCGFSPLFQRQPSFRNALVQSIGGGNTMVFNNAVRDLFLLGGQRRQVAAHDWWAYLLTAAVGGHVIYDPEPRVRYRLHPGNIVGSNVGFLNHARRLNMISKRRFSHWMDLNTEALKPVEPHMTEENRRVFQMFCDARKQHVLGRTIGLLRAGIYRQTALGDFGLIVASLMGRI
jgi:glycosyltransferase involved in cell wall biosynthesis